MESLLRWGITNTNPNAPRPSASQLQNLDPGVIDAILGKSDAEKMKEFLAVGVDASRSEENRVAALDEFELLIEQIDNANNIEKLKMWDPLHALLTNKASPDEVVQYALWIIGTAVQNNPSAQDSYLKLNPLPTLVSLLSLSTPLSSETRSKAIYAISGLLKHNAPAVKQLEHSSGWERLREALQDPDLSVRKKTVFLLAALLHPSESSSPASFGPSNPDSMQSPSTTHYPNSHTANLVDPSRTHTSPVTLEAVQAHGVVPDVIRAVTEALPHGVDGDQEPDADFEEKAVAFLYAYLVECSGTLGDGEKKSFKEWLQSELGKGDSAGRWGLSEGERKALAEKVA